MTNYRTMEDFAQGAFSRCARQFRELQRHGLITDADISEALNTGRASAWHKRFEAAQSEALYRRIPGTRRGRVTLAEIAAVMRGQP